MNLAHKRMRIIPANFAPMALLNHGQATGAARLACGATGEWAMTNFDADTLRDLRDLQEVHIRTEKHRKSAVVIWVVVADDEVFVRSWRGTKGRWHRDLSAGGPATLEFAGRRLAVQ